jgi:RNA polymerase sigma-70 factor, ECF subfamily
MQWPGRKQRVEELVNSHYASLYRYAYRLSGSQQEAEDLTQEAFCTAQKSLDQLRDWTCARGWLFTILRNNYLKRLRHARQENCVPLDSVGDLADRLPDTLPEVDPAQLQRVLGELPEAFRTPVILFYFEDFSYRDIAAQMDVPIGTVMSRLARARLHLRQRLLAPVPVETRGGGP